jgi:hypothetical protein
MLAWIISSAIERPCADPCGYGRWCGYVDHEPAGHDDDAAAVATQVHQTLDVHGQFTTQIAFDDELGDFVTQLFQFAVVQILDLLVGRNAGSFADSCARGRPIP